MDKRTFLRILEEELKNISDIERDEIVNYYDELIEDYIENGCSENEAILRLEDPREIAKRYLIDIRPTKEISFPIRILLWLGFPLWGSILLAGALFILSFFMIIWCVPFIAVVFAFTSCFIAAVGILGAVPIMLTTLVYGIFQLGIGVMFVGVSYWALRLAKQTVQYFKEVSIRILDNIMNGLRNGGVTSWLNLIGLK